MNNSQYKAGFVNLIGKPNVGKSTLINALIGEKISIVSPKIQTTRHRILGIMTSRHHQIVFSDTPGIIQPKYLLHRTMMDKVKEALDDADIICYMADAREKPDLNEPYFQKLLSLKLPLFLLINKIDLSSQDEVLKLIPEYGKMLPADRIIPLSAIKGFNLNTLIMELVHLLPKHPPFFPDEQITDKPGRFIASEIIREKIFFMYHQEIPYSAEVSIFDFQEKNNITRIFANIIVIKESQIPIIIGKEGKILKKVGTQARKELESFFGNKVYLELYVKARKDWRDKPLYLREYGY